MPQPIPNNAAAQLLLCGGCCADSRQHRDGGHAACAARKDLLCLHCCCRCCCWRWHCQLRSAQQRRAGCQAVQQAAPGADGCRLLVTGSGGSSGGSGGGGGGGGGDGSVAVASDECGPGARLTGCPDSPGGSTTTAPFHRGCHRRGFASQWLQGCRACSPHWPGGVCMLEPLSLTGEIGFSPCGLLVAVQPDRASWQPRPLLATIPLLPRIAHRVRTGDRDATRHRTPCPTLGRLKCGVFALADITMDH